MSPTFPYSRILAFLLSTAFLALVPVGATASPKHVLIIHSFGRDYAPYDAIASAFRTELASRSSERIVLHEATLDAGRQVSPVEERAFLDYLHARFHDATPDLVVTIGPPAARFYTSNRDQLFPATPLIIAAVDQRIARNFSLRPGDAAVVGNLSLPQLMDNILGLLPDTKTVAVVLGASDLERFWLTELQREFARYRSRVEFVWLNNLSLEQMQQQVSALPAHSAVLYGLLITDAAGVPHERHEALARLRAATSAPIFGIYEREIGEGVVGGPYSSQRRRAEHMAEAALAILSGATFESPQTYMTGFESPVYDGRELRRWKIDEQRLPSGSEVRFRPPTLWEEHRAAIIVTLGVIVLQSGLIMALLWQRLRRRDAERAAHNLGGRLITAHEDERRRLARDLHDDVTQRLAGLAIEAAGMETGSAGGVASSATSIREGLVKLSEDVHALSYRLHPSVIEDLGLVEALRAECERVARGRSIRIKLDSHAIPGRLHSDTAICLFRIAQEALRNVVRHAKANEVDVSLQTKDGGIVLEVRDDGAGFDELRRDKPASLGLASMRERVRLLGGKLDIDSARDRGTAVVAWVPLPKAA